MREKLLHFPCVSRIHSTSERKNPPDFRREGAKCEVHNPRPSVGTRAFSCAGSGERPEQSGAPRPLPRRGWRTLSPVEQAPIFQ
ncbi:hypothetical protein ETC03_15510 [Geobacillus sp. MMMUD3]|nr:hypothetical protein [Geobacillus sp. MMMUD3]